MRVVLPGIRHWRHDLTHCLHTTMGVLLGHHRIDPLHALGAGWGFRYAPGDVRREEYYYPCAGRSLLAALAPYHPVSSAWHEPADPAQGWAQLRAAVAAGAPVAAAVDNYYLPFRPAYTDVHTNHLLTVYGFDDEADTAFVADPVPPRFQGTIRLGELAAARGSDNPVKHERDLFFTANPLGHRWLSVSVGADRPAWDLDFVGTALRGNLAGFGSDSDPGEYRGLGGQRAFLEDSLPRITEGAHRVDEVFIVAGAMLATTGLHADFLAESGRRFDRPVLTELGRRADRIAHHWSALRIAVATARAEPGPAVPGLLARAHALLGDQEQVLTRMAHVAPKL
jgi:butirosin biosynthesis protein H-like